MADCGDKCPLLKSAKKKSIKPVTASNSSTKPKDSQEKTQSKLKPFNKNKKYRKYSSDSSSCDFDYVLSSSDYTLSPSDCSDSSQNRCSCSDCNASPSFNHKAKREKMRKEARVAILKRLSRTKPK